MTQIVPVWCAPPDPTPLPHRPTNPGAPQCHIVAQGTPEWFALRAACGPGGVFTASRAGTFMRVGYTSQQELWRIATGTPAKPPNRYTEEAMQRGTALEPVARAFLDKFRGGTPMADGQFWTRTIELDGETVTLGASPDGLYSRPDKSMVVVEIKNPMSCTEYDYHEDAKWWNWYAQVQWQLFCTGQRQALLFIHHPSLPRVLWRIDWFQEWWDRVIVAELRAFGQCVRARIPPKIRRGAVDEAVQYWATRLDELNGRRARDFVVPGHGQEAGEQDRRPDKRACLADSRPAESRWPPDDAADC